MKNKTAALLLISVFLTAGFVSAAPITVESDSQEFKDSEKKIFLEGNVKVKTGDVNVVSPRAVVEIDGNNKVNNVKFTDNAYSFQTEGVKKNEVKAQILQMSLLNDVLSAEGSAITSVSEKNRPVVIVTADRQEYHKSPKTVKAFGSVNILYDDIETFSDDASVDLSEKNEVKCIHLSGNSKLTKNNSKINAYRVDYDNIRQIATATGHVFSDITTDDNKRIKVWSNYQSYNKKSNVVTASGNAKIVYEDYTATGPKVTVFADKSNKLNEAVFFGRSKIETKGRTIEADRITITMNPKDFKAEGNVKTTLPNAGR